MKRKNVYFVFAPFKRPLAFKIEYSRYYSKYFLLFSDVLRFKAEYYHGKWSFLTPKTWYKPLPF